MRDCVRVRLDERVRVLERLRDADGGTGTSVLVDVGATVGDKVAAALRVGVCAGLGGGDGEPVPEALGVEGPLAELLDVRLGSGLRLAVALDDALDDGVPV